MAQNNHQYDPIRVSGTAAGTTVLMSNPGIFHNFFIGVTKAGTADFYQTTSAAGTTSTNFLFRFDNAQSTPTGGNLDWSLKGLTVVVSGTTDFVVSIG